SPHSRWVLNGEDDETLRLPGSAPGTRYLFRVESQPSGSEPGGFLSRDGWLTVRVAGREDRILAASELRILGPHNVANSLAAAIVARLLGADPAGIAAGLR